MNFFKRVFDVKKFNEKLLKSVLHSSEVTKTDNAINVQIQGGASNGDKEY